jgi:hypothetical protein
MLRRAALGCLAGFWLLGDPGPPEAFRDLPTAVREAATVVVSGVYTVGRGPDERLPDGRTRWPLLQGFVTKKVYRGVVTTPYIGVEVAYPPRTWANGLRLVEGHQYLLVLRPSAASQELLRASKRSWSWRDVLPRAEVLAIVTL